MESKYIPEYIMAGKAVFTLYSTKIDKRYTYRVKKDKGNEHRFFVEVMFGPDNTADYRFLGWFYDDNMTLKSSQKSCVDEKDMRFRMFKAFLEFVVFDEYPDSCKMYPSGHCARCGRLLTTPESIERGLGPECCKRY